MKKKWIQDTFEIVDTYSDLEHLEFLCKKARKAEKTGKWKNFTLDKVAIPYSEDSNFCIMGDRLETDDEYSRRLAQEAAQAKYVEKHELEILKALKEKYER